MTSAQVNFVDNGVIVYVTEPESEGSLSETRAVVFQTPEEFTAFMGLLWAGTRAQDKV